MLHNKHPQTQGLQAVIIYFSGIQMICAGTGGLGSRPQVGSSQFHRPLSLRDPVGLWDVSFPGRGKSTEANHILSLCVLHTCHIPVDKKGVVAVFTIHQSPRQRATPGEEGVFLLLWRALQLQAHTCQPELGKTCRITR
jgi:hypothetical protein